MSQAKVDKRKEEKINRKQIMRRNKIKSVLIKSAAVLVALAIIGWLGYSINQKRIAAIPRTNVSVNYEPLTSTMNELAAQDTAE